VKVESIRPYAGQIDPHRELELLDALGDPDSSMRVLADGVARVFRAGWALVLAPPIAGQARVLDSVADIVRRQSDPCRPADRTEEPPLSSRIIRAANAFDDLVGSSVESTRAAAAVQRLRLDTASEYDPQVVEALSRLVSRRSVLGP